MAIAEKLPKATILHGDGTDHDLLESRGIFTTRMPSSPSQGATRRICSWRSQEGLRRCQVMPKMSRPNYTALVHDLGIDTVISLLT